MIGIKLRDIIDHTTKYEKFLIIIFIVLCVLVSIGKFSFLAAVMLLILLYMLRGLKWKKRN